MMTESSCRSDLIDLTMYLHHETAKAIKASDKGKQDEAVWLPKSAIEFCTLPGQKNKSLIIVTLPQRLAHEKGLI